MPVDRSRSRMCSLCHQILNEVDDLDGSPTTWHHTGIVPTDCAQVGFQALEVDESCEQFCDFCSSPIPHHASLVRCRPFGIAHIDEVSGKGIGPLVGDDGQWAACVICADLIRHDRWGALTRHSMFCLERKHGKFPKALHDQLFVDLSTLHSTVRSTCLGVEDL